MAYRTKDDTNRVELMQSSSYNAKTAMERLHGLSSDYLMSYFGLNNHMIEFGDLGNCEIQLPKSGLLTEPLHTEKEGERRDTNGPDQIRNIEGGHEETPREGKVPG
ncbi:hypothetical protein DPV78_003424 [Talaromyces pinophilus]|nr:hypothetical protein DPV78_003424 [Talaromyces pinophilus]